MAFFNKKTRRVKLSREMIDPDEILLDSSNLPNFNRGQFQGRLEKPISRRVTFFTGLIFLLVGLSFTGKLFALQIGNGDSFAAQSEQNRLRFKLIFQERGVIYDRSGTRLAWNDGKSEDGEYSLRRYIDLPGLAHTVGYVKYPSKDSAGFYYDARLDGMDGAEKIFNSSLAGTPGVDIIEVDALGRIASHSLSVSPVNGANITLSVDAKVTSALHGFISKLADSVGFEGGAGMLMDLKNGEVIAAASFPEYDQNVMTAGKNSAAIKILLNDPNTPFLNRFTGGLYTPGSIVKPFVALGALTEHIIDPLTKILSTGSISIPNPFDPTKKSVFTDWRPQGLVDMRQALAVSSDVYFYEIGGGFENQPGLGIMNIDKYLRLFGFGEATANPFFDGPVGTIPTPDWKKENFEDGTWRIGDTYNTAIGQYGTQITVFQALRAVASIGSGGKLVEPTIVKDDLTPVVNAKFLPIAQNDLQVVKEGMRQGVLSGTAGGLNISQVAVAAKTGTAELGTKKKFVNSWVIGFYPYENPHYAFAVMMERGPETNTVGGLYVMRELLEWMSLNAPEYLK